VINSKSKKGGFFMKKLVLLSVAMFALSVCAADKIGFCIGKDGNGKLGYVQSDLNNMKGKAADASLDKCVKERYADMTNYVSSVLNDKCSEVRSAVRTFCETKSAPKGYKTETFSYKGKTYNNVLVLHRTTTKCTASTDVAGSNVNNPGDRWFFAPEECVDVNTLL
jgi:hypothetical protein